MIKNKSFRNTYFKFYLNVGPEGLLAVGPGRFQKGLHGVVNGIVDDGFAVGAEAVHLLESAVTAAHSGGEDEKCRFHTEKKI